MVCRSARIMEAKEFNKLSLGCIIQLRNFFSFSKLASNTGTMFAHTHMRKDLYIATCIYVHIENKYPSVIYYFFFDLLVFIVYFYDMSMTLQ